MIRSLFPYQGLVLPYRGLMFLRGMRFGHWDIRDKYHASDFLTNIVIQNTLSIRGRIADWGTRDPIWVLGFYRLIGSFVVLI